MKYVRLWILSIALLLSACAGAPAAESWRFIVTCDSRGGYDPPMNAAILQEFVDEVISKGADFFLFPGDMVSGYTTQGPAGLQAQLEAWLQLMEPLYDAGIPVYVCRGNHEIMDVWGGYRPPGFDPNNSFATAWLSVFGNPDRPRWMLPGNGPSGEQYMTYAVEHKNALIVVLDHYAGMQHKAINQCNQQWLDNQLAGNTKPHVFVAGQEPAFQALHTDCLGSKLAARDAFWASLMDAGARIYLAGHDHFYDHARIDDGNGNPDDDLHQYIVGTGGAGTYAWSPPYLGTNSHYTVRQVAHSANFGYLLVEIQDLNVTCTFMARTYSNKNLPGVYLPADTWQYTAATGPRIVSPNGGEYLTPGESTVIAWKTTEGIDIAEVRIEYSSDSGDNWNEVAVTPNMGSYDWFVPQADSNACLLRISNTLNPEQRDTTNAAFMIRPCLRDLKADLNNDCYVNHLDFLIMAEGWLDCAYPADPACNPQP